MIKNFFRAVIVSLLSLEAKLVLRKYQPRLAGITGSVGKTSVKDAVYAILAKNFSVRRSEKSFNSEIGVPLSILGQPNAWGRPLDWLKNLLAGLNLIIFRHSYPRWLVLEIGADRPGDIRRFSRWLKFDLIVITSLPPVPAHIEFFSLLDELIAEKLSLLEALKPGGRAILNGDDEEIAKIRTHLIDKLARYSIGVSTYGFSQGNDLRFYNEHLIYEKDRPAGYTLKIDQIGHTIPLRLFNLVGRHQLYAVMAGLLVGATLELNLIEMSETVTAYQPPVGRLRLLSGVKETLILDDTYNSSPAAAAAALETLKAIEIKGRRIAVLGDMLELGSQTIEAHRAIGEQAAAICDLLMTVGVRAKFIAEAAAEHGLSRDKMLHYDEAREAGAALEHLLAPGDLILVKGSQSMRMEQVVEEIMAEPEKKKELLCRQEPEWQKR